MRGALQTHDGFEAEPGNSLNAGSAPQAVTRLVLTDFRNYESLRLELDSSPVVLTGDNGAGKTNLLEAVSFLAPGRGLRGARLADVGRRNGPGRGTWAVAAQMETPLGDIAIGTGCERETEPADRMPDGISVENDPENDPENDGSRSLRRQVRMDGVNVRGPGALAERISAIWLTPSMDRLFLEGASGRRRFLDRVVYGFDSGHAARVSSYERAMRERSRLLRQSDGAGSPDPAWLGVLEERMAADGIAVAAARRQSVAQLNEVALVEDGPFPGADVAVTGEVEGWLDEGSALEAEERLKMALVRFRGKDAETGRTAAGVHRSDLAVHHRGKDMPAALCSTGEQKALLISLLLSVARLIRGAKGGAPLLLLDEVAAHLDPERRAALFDRLMDLGAQAWVTGTDPALFSALYGQAQLFNVCDGIVTQT